MPRATSMRDSTRETKEDQIRMDIQINTSEKWLVYKGNQDDQESCKRYA